MTGVERFAGWLSCPDCGRDLEPADGRSLACSSGHRFETGVRGYLGLAPHGARIPAPRHASHAPAGLERGADGDDPVSTALLAMLNRSGRVLDVTPSSGCRLSAVAAHAPALALGAITSSPQILGRIAADSPAAGVLADTARQWPIRDGSVDTLIVVDAAPYPIEFHRITARGAVLLAAPPAERIEALVDDLFPWFEHDQSRPVADTGRIAVRLRRRRRMLTW